MLRTAVLVLALAALVAPPARADTFDVSGDLKLSEAPITTGDVTVGGPGLLTFSAPSDGGDLFRLQCDACDVEVIQVDSTLVDPHPFLPPDYQINTYPRQTPGTPRITLHDAELVGRTPSRWFLAAADFPDPAQLASLEQPRFELRPRQDNYSMQSDDTPGSFPFTYATPGGSLRANWVQGANTSVTATGAAELAFRGLHIHAASQEGEFDWTLGKEYTWIAGTPAGGTVFHFNVTYLIVRAHQPQLVLPAGMSAAFTSPAMTIATQDGRIDLRGSGGWTRIGGADRR